MSYSGYYVSFPSSRGGFDSLHPLQPFLPLFVCLLAVCTPLGAYAQDTNATWTQCLVEARVIKFLTSINDREKNRPAQLEILHINWRDGINKAADKTCGLSIGAAPDAIIYSHSRRALNKLVAGSLVKLEYYVYNSQTPTGPISTSTWTLMTDEAFD